MMPEQLPCIGFVTHLGERYSMAQATFDATPEYQAWCHRVVWQAVGVNDGADLEATRAFFDSQWAGVAG
jgi:hypothetical protein